MKVNNFRFSRFLETNKETNRKRKGTQQVSLLTAFLYAYHRGDFFLIRLSVVVFVIFWLYLHNQLM
mgnify:FL=1